MASVTQRIKEVKQPRGGYINPKDMQKIQLTDENILKDKEFENINPSLVGMAVDYLTRYMRSGNKEEAFKISIIGSNLVNQLNKAEKLLNKITGLDEESICSACKLVGYDVCVRAGNMYYKPIEDINPNEDTVNNIRIMVERSLKFFEIYGDVVKDGITFEGGYTNIVDSGDGDFITKDTLWDFKVKSTEIDKNCTLQLLMYYLMGKHSMNAEFETISKIGIFNPRKKLVYLKDISEVSKEIIDEVENEVIGYNSNVGKKVNNNEYTQNLLGMSDIMKILGCTRYMVMKFYSEKGLPLIKEKNKYYITYESLYAWASEMERIRKEEEKRNNIIVGTTLVITVILIILVFIIIL